LAKVPGAIFYCATIAFSERREISVLLAISKDLKICSKRRYSSPFFDVRRNRWSKKKHLRETIKFLFFLPTRLRLEKQAYRRPIPMAVRS